MPIKMLAGCLLTIKLYTSVELDVLSRMSSSYSYGACFSPTEDDEAIACRLLLLFRSSCTVSDQPTERTVQLQSTWKLGNGKTNRCSSNNEYVRLHDAEEMEQCDI